jgi:hypothetical protein
MVALVFAMDSEDGAVERDLDDVVLTDARVYARSARVDVIRDE